MALRVHDLISKDYNFSLLVDFVGEEATEASHANMASIPNRDILKELKVYNFWSQRFDGYLDSRKL